MYVHSVGTHMQTHTHTLRHEWVMSCTQIATQFTQPMPNS